MVRVLAVACVVAGLGTGAAWAQTGVAGQQMSQPSANQNQSQAQTNQSQTPPGTTVVPQPGTHPVHRAAGKPAAKKPAH